MYHCHVSFYCVGRRRGVFEILEGMPALDGFTHHFTVTGSFETALAAGAEVILADLRELDAPAALRTLAACWPEETQLILLADREQVPALAEEFSWVTDLWTMPMEEAELRFRFRSWQKTFRMSRELWQTGQYLEAAINSSPNLVWYKDKNGIHEKVNDSFCRTVGKTKDQVQGRGHAYIWNVEQDDPACIESEREVMESRVTHVSEEVIRTGDGERILTTYKSPLYDLDGSVMGTVGVALDVTQERAYEQELLKKSQTLETIFTTMDCGIMCHSVDGSRILSVNRAALNILGYQSQEELEEDGFDTVAASVMDEDKPKLRECIRSLHRVNDSSNTEYRVLHKDGTLLHVMGNIKLVCENGELLYQRFLLDCTAQKLREQAEQARMDQQIQYQRQIFDAFFSYLSNNTDDVYLMLSVEGERLGLEYISPNAERVLGFNHGELKADMRLFWRARHISGNAIKLDALRQLEADASLAAVETERINPRTGEHRFFLEKAHCVLVQGEKKIIVYISDRSKERETMATLTEALNMAQVASKAKSTFLSNISHDIRTPMNAITGFVALLKAEADDPEHVREYTQRIDAASQHLLGLINDVLDLNKIESGSATLNIAELDMAEVIDEINTIIRSQAKAKNQTFDIHVNALTNERLLGDWLRINQILINILSNAVKYTQEGGAIRMTVTQLPQAVENYSRIQFVISDNGQGMSEEYQKVIFKPFTREHASVTNQIQGTGLGMSITKSLVDLMGGTIRVKSKPGEGSTFTVELELRIQEKEGDPRFWENHGIARMLIADDEEDVCANVVRAMEETGVAVDHATDGEAAISMIQRALEEGRPYDLLLLDWKMPGLNGLETARRIREDHKVKLPILLFTAYDWEEIQEEALEVGVHHFMPKPFFMSNFKNAIRKMMDKRDKRPAVTTDGVVKGKHILVVDDIDVNRMIMVKILSALGAACETAENGGQAVAMFEAAPAGTYDIILMDIQMPIMDGYAATRAIRASGHPDAKAVPIIAMTANAFVDDVRESMESGMDAHISKPVVVDQMKATIHEVLQNKSR